MQLKKKSKLKSKFITKSYTERDFFLLSASLKLRFTLKNRKMDLK